MRHLCPELEAAKNRHKEAGDTLRECEDRCRRLLEPFHIDTGVKGDTDGYFTMKNRGEVPVMNLEFEKDYNI